MRIFKGSVTILQPGRSAERLPKVARRYLRSIAAAWQMANWPHLAHAAAAAKVQLRQQALAWLHVDLAVYMKLSASGPAAARTLPQQHLKHWQEDSELAGIRDKNAPAKLPADERAPFAKLWAEVTALLRKTEEKAK